MLRGGEYIYQAAINQQMVKPVNKEIKRLFATYHHSWSMLTGARNREFPEGTVVYDPLTKITATVKIGSLYADQVNTDKGHMGWDRLAKITNSNDGKPK